MTPSNRRRLALLVAVPATLAILAPTAWAQDTTGPDSEACTAAEQAITGSGLEAQIGIFTDGPPGTPSLAELEAAVAAGIAKDNAAALAEDSPETVAAKAALESRNSLIAGVQAKLGVLVADRDTACAAPEPTATPEPSADPAPTGTPDPDPTSPPPPPSQPPAPTTTASPTGDTGELYETCADVRAAGAAPLYVTEPGYRAGLDADGDGVACENPDVLYNPIGSGENPDDYTQTGDVPIGAAETGQA